MAYSTLKNPFPVVGYHGPLYFCNRENETKRILENIENGISTTLLSIRRLGKTALIHHVFQQLPGNILSVYADILETENMQQFLNVLATALIKTAPEKSSPGKKMWKFIRSLRPVIHFDSLSGEPRLTFSVQKPEAEANIDTILQFLDGMDQKILIAIDEFQQIGTYPERNADAWLRSRIQNLKNTVFIFSGSRQHIMNNLFANPQRPFYSSTQILKLEKISKQEYVPFVVDMFTRYSKLISPDTAENILSWCRYHTWNVQMLLNRVFSSTKKEVTEASWRERAAELLHEQEHMFYTYRNMLTSYQWDLLKAIALEETVKKPTSASFIMKHQLGSSASVLRAMEALQRYELIYSETDAEGDKYYAIYDIFFMRWVQERYLTGR